MHMQAGAPAPGCLLTRYINGVNDSIIVFIILSIRMAIPIPHAAKLPIHSHRQRIAEAQRTGSGGGV